VTRVHKTDLPAEQPETQAASRIPCAHGDQERAQDPGAPSRQRPQASDGLIGEGRGAAPVLRRLQKRSEFLYVANGLSERRFAVVTQVRMCRTDPGGAAAGSHLSIGEGYTATRKVGSSVVRNRARRRLREAARRLLPGRGVAGADYVFIARQDTAQCDWPRLLDDMNSALITLARRLAAGETSDGPRPARRGQAKSASRQPTTGHQKS
jgi:ribonuclease P protein component